MSIERLYARIVEDTQIWNSPIHGTEHWIAGRNPPRPQAALVCVLEDLRDGGDLGVLSVPSDSQG